MNTDISLNTILYGPPGTGKTYNTVNYAVAICEEKSLEDVMKESYQDVKARYDEYRRAGRIVSTTFHQAYGYEEFIEGIRPVLNDEDDLEESREGLHYKIMPGIFRDLCQKAEMPKNLAEDHNAVIWYVVLKNKSANDLKKECFVEGAIRFNGPNITIEEAKTDEAFSWTYQRLSAMKKGDYVLSYAGKSELIDGVGVIQDDAPFYDGIKKSHQWTRKVKWLLNRFGKTPVNVKTINSDKYLPNFQISKMSHMHVSDLLSMLAEQNAIAIAKNNDPYVLIIDEINRGNISKIFGELITLIEDTKRAGAEEAAEVKLPYSKDMFHVPRNVYILGTMNTADRSIAIMDTALRRRFDFVEMQPNLEVLNGIKISSERKELDVADMLRKMNSRIEVLYDREHTIGHAFFLGLREDNSISKLASVFLKKIIPLLQEYFYEDYRKIQMVLGDNGKERDNRFILDEKVNKSLFRELPEYPEYDKPEITYRIQTKAFYKIDSYIQI